MQWSRVRFPAATIRMLWSLLLTSLFVVVSYGSAHADIEYIYDELGRLIAVVDSTSDTAVYSYDAVGNLLSISRHASSTTAVINFQPKSGPVGAIVTIHGTGFSPVPGANSVSFHGVVAGVVSATPTEIVATVPQGATSGSIGVTSPSGSATSGTSFTVTATDGAPTITGLAPTVGSAGVAVTVTGTNFELVPTQNKVFFYGVPPANAIVTAATATSLQVTVPAKAVSGPLTVTTPAGTGVSSDDFFVPQGGFPAASVVFTDRIEIGGPNVSVGLPSGGKVGLVVFEASAGQRLNLGAVVTSGYPFPSVTVYRPDGAVLPTTPAGSTWAKYLPPLPLSGVYTLLIGSGTFASTISLTLSEEVQIVGEIGGSSINVDLLRAGQRARVMFQAAAGQRVSAGITTNIPSSTLRINDPNDTTLASTGVGTSGAVDGPVLPSAATYAVILEPGSAATGSLTMTLSEEVTASITTDGSSVPISITRPGQRARLTFTGTVGQRLGVGVTAATVGGSLAVYNPGGTTLLSPVGYGTPTGGADVPQLTSTGTHELVVDPSGVSTGNVTITLSEEIAGTITLGGASVPVAITRPGQRARLSFSGTVDQRASHALSGTTINGNVSILRPDGSVLQSAALPSTGFLGPTTLPTTGTYTVLIDPSGGNTGGTTVTSYDVPPDVTGSLVLNDPGVSITISTPGQNATLTFSGTSGQAVTVIGTGNTVGCVMVTLTPSGSGGLFSCSTGFSFGATLSSTGTATVKVDPSGAFTGGVTVRVTHP